MPGPDFIIIGAQRSGTTSLYKYLIEHPNIKNASQKEIHYFDINYDKGLTWYSKQFPSINKDVEITGESSPYYFFHPHAVKRISKNFPNVKLIALLRNPIERAYSHYCMAIKKGNESLSFEEVVKKDKLFLETELKKMIEDEMYHSLEYQQKSYLERGRYAEQLKKWFRLFPREQILIIQSEEFFSDPNKITNKVFEFLGQTQYTLKNVKIFNEGKNQPMNKKTRKYLQDYYKIPNKKLYELINEKYDWN